MKKQTETYSISQVSQLTGVSKNRIREWHDKGFLPQVEWIPVGTLSHCGFTQDDITLTTKSDEWDVFIYGCLIGDGQRTAVVIHYQRRRS